MTYQQYRAVRRLVHSCCNYQDGNCLLLDDGEECVCPQAISYSVLFLHTSPLFPGPIPLAPLGPFCGTIWAVQPNPAQGGTGAMTYQQYRAVRRLVHSCCNYQDGNCLLLDDGEECVCPQSISYSLICRWFFGVGGHVVSNRVHLPICGPLEGRFRGSE